MSETAMSAVSRRGVGTALAALACLPTRRAAWAAEAQFGLTPVFLTSDLDLLDALRRYLSRAVGRDVRLVLRRTYREITSALLAGQLDAAWICGFPFVEAGSRLGLVGVPVWRGRPLYQSYIIVGQDRRDATLDSLRGDAHAFSDPDSNSGFLVTKALLAERGERPEGFFARSFFTYGHRNVVRAVAAGLAGSGSVDGYVWEVMTETEPDLTARTRVIWRSDWMGFPPVAAAATDAGLAAAFRTAFASMADDAVGREVLVQLRLDGFASGARALYDPIAERIETVRRLG